MTLTQTFVNNTDSVRQAQYRFPMDVGAAIERVEMRVGGETIVAEVQEKGAAKRTYDAAVHRGDGAVMATEDSTTPDAYVFNLGNVLPRTEVQVVVSYVTELDLKGPTSCLTFPSKLMPRYVPFSFGNVPLSALGESYSLTPESYPVTYTITLDKEYEVKLPGMEVTVSSIDLQM